MEKTRPFSIYLLKPEFDRENSLAADHKLKAVKATKLPEGASLYIMDAKPNGNDATSYLKPISEREIRVVFGIITHKDASLNSDRPSFTRSTISALFMCTQD